MSVKTQLDCSNIPLLLIHYCKRIIQLSDIGLTDIAKIMFPYVHDICKNTNNKKYCPVHL